MIIIIIINLTINEMRIIIREINKYSDENMSKNYKENLRHHHPMSKKEETGAFFKM